MRRESNDQQASDHEPRHAYDQPTEESYEREDERWSRASQLRDWLIIIIFLMIHFGWMYIVFRLEPGIR